MLHNRIFAHINHTEGGREMADACHVVSARNTTQIPSSFPVRAKSVKLLSQPSKIRASSRRNDLSRRKSGRPLRRLITISTSDGRWQGNWTRDYHLSLGDLRLQDLVEDEDNKDAGVLVRLCVHKHASCGLSVDGRIVTSFTRKCCICLSPYCREIDTNFNVWVLPQSREKSSNQLPEIGGDDPSVIFVKPGEEADFDSLVQDAIRLTTSAEDACSESCVTSEPTWKHEGKRNVGSTDKRWSRLLELKNAYRDLHM